MCIDMGVSCRHVCVDMCLDMCLDMCVVMRVDMCAGMCIDMRAEMCVDTRQDMRETWWGSRSQMLARKFVNSSSTSGCVSPACSYGILVMAY